MPRRSRCHPLAFLALILHAGAAVRPAPARAETLRVITYNIHQGQGLRTPGLGPYEFRVPLFGWRVRIPRIPLPVGRPGQMDRIAGHLRELHPDLVLLQEVDRPSLMTLGVDQGQVLADRMRMHLVYGKAHSSGWGFLKTQGNAILSRFPVMESRTVTLHGNQGSAEARSMILARIRVPGAPDGIWAASVHLSAEDPGLRGTGADRVVEVLSGCRGPILLGGDFNAEPDSEPVRRVIDGSRMAGFALTDVFAAVGSGPGATSAPPHGTRRIDYLLSGAPFRPLDARRLEDLLDSDHFAVMADLGLDPGDAGASVDLLGIRSE